MIGRPKFPLAEQQHTRRLLILEKDGDQKYA